MTLQCVHGHVPPAFDAGSLVHPRLLHGVHCVGGFGDDGQSGYKAVRRVVTKQRHEYASGDNHCYNYISHSWLRRLFRAGNRSTSPERPIPDHPPPWDRPWRVAPVGTPPGGHPRRQNANLRPTDCQSDARVRKTGRIQESFPLVSHPTDQWIHYPLACLRSLPVASPSVGQEPGCSRLNRFSSVSSAVSSLRSRNGSSRGARGIPGPFGLDA
jgi:hypothetical protein